MTGALVNARGPAVSPIPSHPGSIACIDFINSAATDYLGRGEDFDRLTMAEWRAWFLSRYEFTVRPRQRPPMARLVTVRSHLRAMLETWATEGRWSDEDVRRLDRWIGTPWLRRRVVLSGGSLRIVDQPIRSDWQWVISRVALSALELIQHGSPQQLKVCANLHCSWMFEDRTLNGSKRYCSSEVCSNLVRVRRFRDRHQR